MSEESSHTPSERKQDGWPAPDGSQPSPDSTPTAAWNANSGPHPQWNQAVSSPPAGQPQQWDAPQGDPQSSYWNQPSSSGSWSSAPTSVPPQPGPYSAEPQSGAGWGAPPQSPFPQYQPRIEPTPPKRGNPIVQVIVGFAVGALVAGAGGYLIGAATGGPAEDPDPKPSAAAVSLFDTTQAATNKAKLDAELTGLGQPWLTSSLGDCISNVDNGAPPLSGDENRHVTCRYGSAWVHFVVYKSADEQIAARNYRLQLNLNSDEVAPGVRDPSRTPGGVSGVPGRSIEYAFRLDDGRSLCGISWERDEDQLAAMMIEAHCEEVLGGKWEPLRDLWQRHS